MLCKAVSLAVDQAMPAWRVGRAQCDQSKHRCNAWFDDECKRLRALELTAELQDADFRMLQELQDANSPEAKEAAKVYWQRIRCTWTPVMQARQFPHIADLSTGIKCSCKSFLFLLQQWPRPIPGTCTLRNGQMDRLAGSDHHQNLAHCSEQGHLATAKL